ncbi:MAG: EAL domain-containing protein [Methylocystaceae bacterium]|nr:EAL domain-containing protein [Methylocystaceae bacterium]
MAEPKKRIKPQKNTYGYAFLVLVVGVLISAAVSFFILNLQTDRHDANLRAQTNDYIYAFSQQLERKIRSLSPIVGQANFENENLNHQKIFERLESLTSVLKRTSFNEGYMHLAWVTAWAGENHSTLADNVIAQNEWARLHTGTFLEKMSPVWSLRRLRSVTNEVSVFGVDVVDEQGTVNLVVGHPFFQKISTDKMEQFPIGYLMGWLDIAYLMRASWNDYRNPNLVVYLKLDPVQGDPIYLTYQSGLIEIVSEQDLPKTIDDKTAVSFRVLDKDMTLNIVSLDTDENVFLRNIYWVVFFAGLFSTLLWSLLVLKLKNQTISGETQNTSFEDVNQRLASESAHRRNIESILKTNDARWHHIVDNLPVALFSIDNTGMFTLGEGKGLQPLGLKAGTVEGNSVFEIFADYPDLINMMRETLEGEERSGVFQINRHWFDMRFSPVRTTDGIYDGVLCVAIDVSSEHNVRERLDKVNMHLRGLMANVPTGVAFVRGGTIQWCSRYLEELFGYSDGSLKGRSPEILYDTVEEYSQIEEAAREALRRKKTYESKVLFRRNDTTRFKGQISGRLVDQSTPKAGTMWVVQDLTHFIEEEKERRLSQTVFDNVVEGVMVTNTENEIVFVNKAFVSITGYQENEVIGNTPDILGSGRHSLEFFSNMHDEVTKSGEWEGEVWNRRKNGEIYLQWLNVSCLRNEDGSIYEYVSVFNDITTHRKTQEMLSYQSNYDQLTGLPNRHLLADRFSQAAAQANRENKAFSLVYMDLDNFKYLNESLGHTAGDHIIKIIAERIDNNLRSVDTVARIGGDEFIILLVGAGDEQDASRAVAHLSMSIADPITIGDQENLLISASCGVALFPKDGESLSELSRKADAALYRAKETERGMFMFFTEDMDVRAQERMQLETRLRKAISLDELHLYYQPKVDIITGEVYGAEALIRWINPELGMIGPDKFIPIAEETGLIVPIGEWVFKEACRQIKDWLNRGVPIHNVAVNLSGRQFTKPDLAHDIITIIHESGIDPSMLEIEITESFIASSESGIVEALNILSGNGIKLSVDDFGTGYSSLNYLHRFPLDIMKIDRSFIMGIGEAGQSQDITENLAKAVIAIAKSMNLKIVGEGVETEAQLDFLRKNGCDLMQGYYFSKPLPADEFEALLLSGRTL